MKQFEFNHKTRRWDRYKAFHNQNGLFVEFETGELIITDWPKPGNRKFYPRYDITLSSSSETDLPQLYLDKDCTQPIPQAWLQQGDMQYIAIDHTQNVAVRLHTSWRTENLQYLPSHVDTAKVLWTGPDRLPVPLAQFVVSQPDKEVRKELAPKLQDVRAAIRAAVRIQNLSPLYSGDKMRAEPKWADLSVDEIVEKVLVGDDSVSNAWSRMVATNGFAYPRMETKHDYLYIKKG
jgi:hypothetical protein